MTDTRIIQLIARKLSGESTAEERTELDQLLTRDPEAVYYVELITQLWDEEKIREIGSREVTDTDIAYLKHLARHRPTFAPSPSIPKSSSATPLQPPIQTTEPQKPPSAKSRQFAWLLFFVLLAAGMLYGISRLNRSSSTMNGNTEFFTQLGSRRQLTLPDGTKVWLNAGSRLSYDSNMLRKDTRTVTLSGEAFFDVAKDKDRSFVIHTDKISIRVLGTAFNVKAYPRDKITETTLMRGSVELTVNNKPYQKIVLKPREKFALIDDSQTDPGSNADPSSDSNPVPAKPGRPATPLMVSKEKLVIQDVTPIEVEDKEYVKEVSWVEDNFVFQNETLEELAPKMERWFNVKIEIDNARIRSLHFTGIFHKETADQAFSALQFIQPFKFKIIDNHVYIN